MKLISYRICHIVLLRGNHQKGLDLIHCEKYFAFPGEIVNTLSILNVLQSVKPIFSMGWAIIHLIEFYKFIYTYIIFSNYN